MSGLTHSKYARIRRQINKLTADLSLPDQTALICLLVRDSAPTRDRLRAQLRPDAYALELTTQLLDALDRATVLANRLNAVGAGMLPATVAAIDAWLRERES